MPQHIPRGSASCCLLLTHVPQDAFQVLPNPPCPELSRQVLSLPIASTDRCHQSHPSPWHNQSVSPSDSSASRRLLKRAAQLALGSRVKLCYEIEVYVSAFNSTFLVPVFGSDFPMPISVSLQNKQLHPYNQPNRRAYVQSPLPPAPRPEHWKAKTEKQTALT